MPIRLLLITLQRGAIALALIGDTTNAILPLYGLGSSGTNTASSHSGILDTEAFGFATLPVLGGIGVALSFEAIIPPDQMAAPSFTGDTNWLNVEQVVNRATESDTPPSVTALANFTYNEVIPNDNIIYRTDDFQFPLGATFVTIDGTFDDDLAQAPACIGPGVGAAVGFKDSAGQYLGPFAGVGSAGQGAADPPLHHGEVAIPANARTWQYVRTVRNCFDPVSVASDINFYRNLTDTQGALPQDVAVSIGKMFPEPVDSPRYGGYRIDNLGAGNAFSVFPIFQIGVGVVGVRARAYAQLVG